MFLTDDLLHLDDPDTHQVWRIPLRQITAVDAAVSERWLVNARIPLCRFRELVTAPFLEPRLVAGSVLLTLCATRIRHAAPTWAPLGLGPPSMNCTLRVACRDGRDGRPCVWVAERFTDSVLAPALAKFGFPPVSGGLIDQGGPGRLDLTANDGLVRVHVRPGRGPTPELFEDATALAAFVAAGVRSYTPGCTAGRWAVIDVESRGLDGLTHLEGWEGWLRTPWGDCTIDGVYLTRDGLYRWTKHGDVDEHGQPC